MKKGMQNMNADQVLWYVRTRKTTNDFARNRRQQEVLAAIGRKFLSMDALSRAPELYDFYINSVTTDLSLDDVLPLLPVAALLTEESRFRQYYITPKVVYDWITPGGAMVLLPRRDAVMKIVRKALSGK
jgi:anionic cell wall polymer biosynthesis LytR-Cps2A-Psr (LCP) family protein